MKKPIPFLLLFLLLITLSGTAKSQDSLAYILQGLVEEDSLIREEMRFKQDGIVLPLRAIIQTFTHRSFNNHPGPFREANHRWEDYVPALSPLAATWVLKACGVRSRSTTQRLLTSNAMALGLTVGLTEMLKASVTETRPDGSDGNSFPSMHASLAFMGATILAREYGHISPWISIGGYTAATATQMLRIGHNAHWMNDVFMGAGIGVVSTNLAYFITDKILGPKGIAYNPRTQEEYLGRSGIRLLSGTETSGRELDVSDFAEAVGGFDLSGVRLRSSAAITTGFEAEWFPARNVYLAAIARYTMTQTKLDIPTGTVAWGELMHIYHGNVAAGWTASMEELLPTGGAWKGLRFSLRTLWGVRHNESIDYRRVADGQQLGETLMHIPSQLKPEGGAGFAIDFPGSRKQVIGFHVDYLHTFGTNLLPNRWVLSSSWKALF